MKRLVASTFFFLAGCVATGPASYPDPDLVGVWCSSKDNGATCWAYGETYPNGTVDSCGREPSSGTEFAMVLTSEAQGAVKCETVVKTSHPKVMPVGERFCSRILSKSQDRYTYSFTDDSQIRTTYRRPRAEKWCQPAIDALR